MPLRTAADWQQYKDNAAKDLELWKELEASSLDALGEASLDAQLRSTDPSALQRLENETKRYSQIVRGRWAAEARLEAAGTILAHGWQF
jgi:hypothetical protein